MPTTFLMYHELELPGRALAESDPGYVRYCAPVESFRAQMDRLATLGMRGLSVSEWVDDAHRDTPAAVITFDDGCETDLIAAAPILRERGFNATCYLTVDFLGRRGFLTRAQARELAASGIDVGCHSMSHAFLSDLDDAALFREVVEAKHALEDICGARVRSFSCPGGRYDDRALPLALGAGYDSVTTSRVVQNTYSEAPQLLGRAAIMRNTNLGRFEELVLGRGFGRVQLRDGVLAAAKALLGNTLYQRLRAGLLP